MNENEQNNASPEPGSGVMKTNSIVQTVIGDNAASLNEIMLSNIKKLQNDPAFLEQAKEIREQVKGIVDIAKTQIEMFKISKN